ncbi:MAG: PIN domain-containing protein [Candidatus Brocadiales bacterium]
MPKRTDIKKIVFDTNVIFDDWCLNKPALEPFEMFLRLSGAKLVVPQLVIEEAKNKYREVVKNSFNSATNELKKLSGLLPFNNLSMPTVVLECAFSDYEECIQARLTDLCAQMPDHSDVPHEDVIKRDLARRRPFRESGKGYRDTLIWEVILRKVADVSYETIFITDNHKDFGEKDSDEVNGDLKEDLQSKGLPDSCVKRYDSVKAFNEKYAMPLLTKYNEEKSRYTKKITFWFQEKRDLIIEILQTKVEGLSWPSQLDHYADDPTILYLEDPSVFKIEEVYKLDADRVYIDIFMETDVSVDFFVHKQDYWAMSDDRSFKVCDEDWNERYIWAEIILREPISLTITYNTKEEKVEKFEADFIFKKERFGHCKSCGKEITSDAAEVCSCCGKSLIEQVQ